jgi:uncharacterized membrane protein YobD (UPF0266 family)
MPSYMCRNYTNSDCHGCHESVRKEGPEGHASLVGNLLLVLMPKCSFCVLAYTSTILLCTKDETLVASSLHASPLTISITAVLCLIVFVGVLLNRRGRRTRLALAVVLTGMALMMITVVRGGGEALYYAGNMLVFAGIWINGSFLYVWRQLRQAWKNISGLEPARADRSL